MAEPTTDQPIKKLIQFFASRFLLGEPAVWRLIGMLKSLKHWIVQTDPSNAQFVSAVLCLGLFTSARVAEQVRAGIQSLARGQRLAGMALGLTNRRTATRAHEGYSSYRDRSDPQQFVPDLLCVVNHHVRKLPRCPGYPGRGGVTRSLRRYHEVPLAHPVFALIL